MEIVASPSRILKTYSFWITVALFAFDSLGPLLGVFESVGLDHQAVVVINAVVLFIVSIVRFIKQNIPVTADEKVENVIAAAQAPIRPSTSITPLPNVTVDGQKVSP